MVPGVAVAQTFAALALGLARYRSDVRVAGVVANRVGSEGHARLLGAGLPADLPLVAALKRQPELALPERHLGLVQALELPALDAQLDAWAQAWRDGEALGSGGGLAAARLPLRLAPPAPEPLPRTRKRFFAPDLVFIFGMGPFLICRPRGCSPA